MNSSELGGTCGGKRGMCISPGPRGLLLSALATVGVFCVVYQPGQLSGSQFKVAGAPSSASPVA